MNVKKFLSILSLSILLAVQQASACPFCYGAKDGKSAENMSVAIWFLFAAIMTVLGGVGAFSYSIYRHSRTPLTPDQKLIQEDLAKYD